MKRLGVLSSEPFIFDLRAFLDSNDKLVIVVVKESHRAYNEHTHNVCVYREVAS